MRSRSRTGRSAAGGTAVADSPGAAEAASVYRDARARIERGLDEQGCAALGRDALAAIESKFASLSSAGGAIACEPGCSFCCHLRVAVFPHEAVALLGYLRSRMPPEEAAAIEQRIHENARLIDGMTADEHRSARLACAFLVDGRCSAHAARPSACASYHSLSRSRCEYSYEHPLGIGTPRNSRPALLELQAFTVAVREAVERALFEAGLPATKGELHQALRALIERGRALGAPWNGGPLRALRLRGGRGKMPAGRPR